MWTVATLPDFFDIGDGVLRIVDKTGLDRPENAGLMFNCFIRSDHQQTLTPCWYYSPEDPKPGKSNPAVGSLGAGRFWKAA